MLEQETNPVGVHPPVPDVDVKATDRLPEGGEDGVGQRGRVGDRPRAARLQHEHRQTVPVQCTWEIRVKIFESA